MMALPASVKYLDSAAASAAKARALPPANPTRDALDVAVALKCMSSFQTILPEELWTLDDEKVAAPLSAAARTLQSTAQQLQKSGNAGPDEANELLLNAALAFAMHGNFPSARAVVTTVETRFVLSNEVFRMVAAICDPAGKLATESVLGTEVFEEFRLAWYLSLRSGSEAARVIAFQMAMSILGKRALAGGVAEGSFVLNARVAGRQALRLATVRLLDDATEVPAWFVTNAIESGIVTLLPPQRTLLADERIASHTRNSLLTLPTSTGKTLVAEACLVAALQQGGLCVYVAPYVAIGNQVKDSLERKVKGALPVVAMFGGFQLDSLNVFANSEILVATPERFDAWLRAGQGVDKLRTVVFDEVHIVENGSRGARVECLVSRLRMMQATNPNLRLVGLSAVLTEPLGVREWMGVAEEDMHQIGWRPTARRIAVCLSNGDMYWMHGNDALRPRATRPNEKISGLAHLPLETQFTRTQFPLANQQRAAENVGVIAADLFKRLAGGPGLVVCPRKLDTRLLARVLFHGTASEKDVELERTANSIVARYPWLSFLADCIRKGLAYHNAALPFDVRCDIERLTRERRMHVVCATTTLAEGADLPFRWTIVSHWLTSMRDDGTRMKSMTFRNIAGRCGRAGAFSEGDTVIFENLMGPPSAVGRRGSNIEGLQEVMFSSSPLESTMSPSASGEPLAPSVTAAFGSQLLACIAEHPEADDIVQKLLDASYATKSRGRNQLDEVLQSQLSEILDASAHGGALAVANSPVRLTDIGVAANRSGFSPASTREMMAYLGAQTFESGATLYSSLLAHFSLIAEQPSDVLRKICTSTTHKSPMKVDDLESVLHALLVGTDLREVFDELPARKRSKAKPESVETQFEEFVSFIDSAVANFLPWLLRALASMSPFGSAAAAAVTWSDLARELENKLRERTLEEPEEDGESEA
jgi:helicase